ncbi:MAG: hypothetical protein JZU53_00900 [Paludibacter sp.]|nr:hypothetical protein [Paludibacter sp.]
MNTTLDINRLGLLFRRFFIENKQRELTFWGITTVVFTLMHLAGSQEKSISVEMFLYISGFIFAARTFKIFNYTPGGMHYLLIPATHLEKLTTAILLSTFYYFVMVLITYSLGTIFGTTIGNFFFESNNPIVFALFNSIPDLYNNSHAPMSLLNKFILFAGIQSVFMLGSIYFKGNAVGKTFLAITAIAIVLGIIELLLLRITFGTYHIEGQMMNISIDSEHGFLSALDTVSTVFAYALIPFFWIVSYFRLKEKQV